VISECWTLARKISNPSGDLLVNTVNPPSTDRVPPVKNSGETSSSTNFHPFISEGCVSLSENGETVTVKLLCDTGATQSLLVDSTLPLSEQTSIIASADTRCRAGCDQCPTSPQIKAGVRTCYSRYMAYIANRRYLLDTWK